MMKWWWAGAFGALQKSRRGWASTSRESVALVVGSTGIVGEALLDILPRCDTPGGPWKVYALSRRPLPPWFIATRLADTHLEPDLYDPAAVDEEDLTDVTHFHLDLGEHTAAAKALSPIADVTHIHLDLADHAAVDKALKPLTDITHVFYVAWDPRPTEAESREANCAMLRNVLSVVVPNCPNLVHVCLQTSRKRYIDPFESLSSIPSALRLYSEDLPRLNYPDLEDVLLDGLAFEEGAVTWSVHRPTTIFGFSPRSARNVVASLCVYAAICRKEGVKLRWPGSRVAWEGFSDASDAELVAEHALWAALEPSGKNAAFNCSNGDIYKWKQLWPMLAHHFDVEWSGYEGEDQRFKLVEAMAGKEAVWAEIVNENELAQTELADVAAWWFVDAVFDVEKENLDTMNKSKEYGFLGFRNTVRSFNDWIDKMKVNKIVP